MEDITLEDFLVFLEIHGITSTEDVVKTMLTISTQIVYLATKGSENSDVATMTCMMDGKYVTTTVSVYTTS